MTTEEIVSKYGGSENVKESIKLQHMIEDYVLLLQTKVRNEEISAVSKEKKNKKNFALYTSHFILHFLHG